MSKKLSSDFTEKLILSFLMYLWKINIISLSFQPCVFMDPEISKCSIVNVNDSTALPKSFTFDGVYYTDSTTEQIYNEIAYPLVEVLYES